MIEVIGKEIWGRYDGEGNKRVKKDYEKVKESMKKEK